jgi:hypothetical protein
MLQLSARPAHAAQRAEPRNGGQSITRPPGFVPLTAPGASKAPSGLNFTPGACSGVPGPECCGSSNASSKSSPVAAVKAALLPCSRHTLKPIRNFHHRGCSCRLCLLHPGLQPSDILSRGARLRPGFHPDKGWQVSALLHQGLSTPWFPVLESHIHTVDATEALRCTKGGSNSTGSVALSALAIGAETRAATAAAAAANDRHQRQPSVLAHPSNLEPPIRGQGSSRSGSGTESLGLKLGRRPPHSSAGAKKR